MINRRYVVTAAHCHDPSKRGSRISEVVLGDHDLSSDPDCKDGACWKPLQKFRISRSAITLHEKWDASKVVTDANDIALIRLPRPAYTIYEICEVSVIPICLPWGRLPNGEEATLPQGN